MNGFFDDDAYQLILSGSWDFLLLTAWRALPLAVVALVVDLGFRRWLAAKYLVLLWMIVAVRLLLPLSFTSTWSVQGPFDRAAAVVFAPTDATELNSASIVVSSERTILAASPSTAIPVAVEPAFDVELLGMSVAVTIYVLIVMALLFRCLIAHWRFAYRLRACQRVEDAPFIDLMLRECDALRVPRRPTVKVVSELSTPAVFGLLRPTICLPRNARETMSDHELRWVVRHELAHVRRRDAWLLALVELMRCCHWLNPVAWLVASRLRMHIENAADDLALGTASASDAIDYGRLLLRLAEQVSPTQPSAALGFLQFVAGRRLRQRIENLTRQRTSRRRWLSGVLIVATLALAFVGLSDAAEEQHSVTKSDSMAFQVPHLEISAGQSTGDDNGPASFQSFDVSEVLRRIRQCEPNEDADLMLRSLSQIIAPRGEFQIKDEHLLANVTARQHQALTQLLEAWRAGGPQQIVLEMRTISTHQQYAAGIDWVNARVAELEVQGPQPAIAAKVTDDQLRRFMVVMQGDAQSQIVFAPKLTLFNGQMATIMAETQRPFVTAVEPRDGNAFEPVIRVLSEGLKAGVQMTTTGDEVVTLTLNLQVSKISEVPLANLPYGLRDGSGATTVQVPNQSTSSVQGSVRLKKAESLLIAMPQLYTERDPAGAERAVYYALTPRVLDLKKLD